MTEHMTSIEEADDGWWIAQCSCGTFGVAGLPDADTASDHAGDHRIDMVQAALVGFRANWVRYLSEEGATEEEAARFFDLIGDGDFTTAAELAERLEAERAALTVVAACRVCGCTDDRACPGGCAWVEPDLCSVCAHALDETGAR